MGDIYNIIGRVLSGEASVKDKADLDTWILESEENENIYESLVYAYENKGVNSDVSQRNSALKLIKDRIKNEAEAKTGKLFSLKWYSAVASIVLIVSLGGALNYQLNKPFSYINTLGYTVEKSFAGEQKTVLLSDGTKIFLNGDSRFKYKSFTNSEKRIVGLDGEAFFDVARNEKKPFLIELSNAGIQVLGTSFNVKSYADDIEIETSVKTGKVAFSLKNKFFSFKKSKTIFLEKGQKGIINKNDESLKSGLNKNEFAWMNNKLVFENTSLFNISKALYRTYGAVFEFENEGLKELKITAKFENENLDEILKMLEMTKGFSFEKREEIIFISKK